MFGPIPSMNDLNTHYSWDRKGDMLTGIWRGEGQKKYNAAQIASCLAMSGHEVIANVNEAGAIEIKGWQTIKGLVDAGLQVGESSEKAVGGR